MEEQAILENHYKRCIEYMCINNYSIAYALKYIKNVKINIPAWVMNVRDPYQPKGYKEETYRETLSDKWTLICEAWTFFSKYYNDLLTFFKKNPNSL